MAKRMKLMTAVSIGLFLLFATLQIWWQEDVLLTLCITCGVFAYHFSMRLLVGWTINAIFHNRMNCYARWFAPHKFETALYAFLRVRKWKRHVPTYDPDIFSPRLHSWQEIAMATCQAEVVHELIAVLSFLPLLLVIPFGTFPVFLITSLLAALIDMVFVILQRYNRPMILSVVQRQQARAHTRRKL